MHNLFPIGDDLFLAVLCGDYGGSLHWEPLILHHLSQYAPWSWYSRGSKKVKETVLQNFGVPNFFHETKHLGHWYQWFLRLLFNFKKIFEAEESYSRFSMILRTEASTKFFRFWIIVCSLNYYLSYCQTLAD